MDRTYLRGDLYFADLGKGVGSEQEGNRPVVIIQNDVGNFHSPTVIVAAISSKVGIKPKLPTHYYIDSLDGLDLPSVVLLEQIRTIDKRRLDKYIGRLRKKHLDGLNHALAVSVDLVQTQPQSGNICLCHACAEKLLRSGVFVLHRIDLRKREMNTCSCCHHRYGYDYEVAVRNGNR